MRLYKSFVATGLIAMLSFVATASASDPRLAIDEVRACVENAKNFMKSTEYSGQENEQELIGACRDADPECVKEAGESFHSSESLKDKAFLEIVRACRGKGMGKCFRMLKGTVSSHDRRELSQITALLKKCN